MTTPSPAEILRTLLDYAAAHPALPAPLLTDAQIAAEDRAEAIAEARKEEAAWCSDRDADYYAMREENATARSVDSGLAWREVGR